ncbi:hypothetical protein [Euzebya sp.]|uniref:hypothetical protein n=1 Tax=Euzebya sp. TaxID=1971409 RepID=UPI003510FB58
MTDPVDLREQLAAFLAGELDGAAADALQDRIDAEPWVAHLADEMADLLVELGGVDDVTPPPGYADRLADALAAEIGHPLPAAPDPRALAATGAAAATGWAEQHTGPRGRRPGSARPAGRGSGGDRRRRLTRALAVAAVFVVIGVATVGVLDGGLFGSASDSGSDEGAEFAQDEREVLQAGDAAEDDAADGDAADGDAAATEAEDPAVAAAPAPTEEVADAAAEEGSAGAGADALIAIDGPAVLDLGPVDPADLGPVLTEDPATQALLGLDATAAADRARAHADELLRATYPDQTPAGTCVREVLDAAGPDLVPAVAATAELPDGPVIAFALVRSAGGEALDAVDVWVVDPSTCAVQQVIS